MRNRLATVCLLLLVLPLTQVAAAADGDTKNSREREMLRRAQEALRQSQADNGTLAQGKAEAEQKLKSASAQMDALRNASRSEQSALRAKLKAAGDAQADVSRQLDEANRRIAALTAQQKETAGQLAARESELKQIHQDLDSSRGATASCEAKNLKLYEYAREVANRYQNKGVWAALAQKEPITGIGGVGVENVVQEYRDKFDSQRVRSAPAPQAAAPVTDGRSPSSR